jgi:dynein heavy chain 1
MVTEQKEAELKRELSIKTSKELTVKQADIATRQEAVHNDLSKAEPALEAAQKSVEGIQKNHLDELRSLAKPPENVKKALEPVIALISSQAKVQEWTDIKAWLRKDNFKEMVMGFNKDNINPKVKAFIKKNYLEKTEDFDVDKIMRASQAAGPLAKWVKSLIEYAEIFDSILPLRNEVAALEEQETEMRSRKQELDALVQQLDHNILQYKQEYGQLIGELQVIKADKAKVQEKVSRSQKLIQNLSAERVRWEASSQSFKEQIACLMGDVLLAAAFLTYTGFFDHFYR